MKKVRTVVIGCGNFCRSALPGPWRPSRRPSFPRSRAGPWWRLGRSAGWRVCRNAGKSADNYPDDYFDYPDGYYSNARSQPILAERIVDRV